MNEVGGQRSFISYRVKWMASVHSVEEAVHENVLVTSGWNALMVCDGGNIDEHSISTL